MNTKIFKLGFGALAAVVALGSVTRSRMSRTSIPLLARPSRLS